MSLSVLLLLSWVALAVPAFGAEVSLFAAASLTDALKELVPVFQKEHGTRIVLNLGASSTLARQIEEGAPADIFFSADEAQMERLAKKGLVRPETRTNLLSNSLVVIVAADHGATVRGPEDLPRLRRIALGDPKAVPIGVYARAYLEQRHLWRAVEPKLLLGEDVRAALAAVAAGNADAAIVYKTDAAISPRVKVAYEVPPKEGPPIRYPAAVLKEARDSKSAKAVLDFLASERATAVFRKYGFLPSPGP